MSLQEKEQFFLESFRVMEEGQGESEQGKESRRLLLEKSVAEHDRFITTRCSDVFQEEIYSILFHINIKTIEDLLRSSLGTLLEVLSQESVGEITDTLTAKGYRLSNRKQ
jgi:hypothetical protein